MLRSELTDELAKEFEHYSLIDITKNVQVIIDILAESLGKGQRIELRGFGTFSLHYHPARNTHIPKTGKRLVTPAKYSPHFKPGKILKKRVNGG